MNDYVEQLKRIWKSGWLTNDGELVRDLESRLAEYLKVPYLVLVSNGTLALQLAIKALNLRGEIITTPFSYVATTSSIVWEGCIPVFADIDPVTLCISPDQIVQRISRNTCAILATHVFGHACDIEQIEEVAKAHNLKVIYDAAHTFGVDYRDQALVNNGDCSTLSFHATKVFHTAEGGAVICKDEESDAVVRRLRNFGHISPTAFREPGINAKMSELHAAMGLCMLPLVEEIILKRRELAETYDELLSEARIVRLHPVNVTKFNYAYYPVLFESEEVLLRVMEALKVLDVYPRRYFYPSLNLLPYLSHSTCPISEDVSTRILCLPIYPGLSQDILKTICDEIISAIA